jgi:hypothetical protein
VDKRSSLFWRSVNGEEKQALINFGTSWLTEIKEELKFAFQCHGSSKVRKLQGLKGGVCTCNYFNQHLVVRIF